MGKQQWLEVNAKGMRQLLAGRDKAFILRELVQNAWDEPGVTEVNVTLKKIPGRAKAELVVDDDAPEGFHDLTHAWTLFAENRKRKDPTKRGRFNMGEKEVLVLCDHASIATTTGCSRKSETSSPRRERTMTFSAAPPRLLRETERSAARGRVRPPATRPTTGR